MQVVCFYTQLKEIHKLDIYNVHRSNLTLKNHVLQPFKVSLYFRFNSSTDNFNHPYFRTNDICLSRSESWEYQQSLLYTYFNYTMERMPKIVIECLASWKIYFARVLIVISNDLLCPSYSNDIYWCKSAMNKTFSVLPSGDYNYL